ncbi:hypothetical protein LINGRAPRIM_LOCUS2814 [Linum grandiflorum]
MCSLQASKEEMCSSRVSLLTLFLPSRAPQVCLCPQGLWCQQCLQDAHGNLITHSCIISVYFTLVYLASWGQRQNQLGWAV